MLTLSMADEVNFVYSSSDTAEDCCVINSSICALSYAWLKLYGILT